MKRNATTFAMAIIAVTAFASIASASPFFNHDQDGDLGLQVDQSWVAQGYYDAPIKSAQLKAGISYEWKLTAADYDTHVQSRSGEAREQDTYSLNRVEELDRQIGIGF